MNIFKLFRSKSEYNNLIINYRLLTKDFKIDEDEIVIKALRHLNGFKAFNLTLEQELNLIEKLTKGEINLD